MDPKQGLVQILPALIFPFQEGGLFPYNVKYTLSIREPGIADASLRQGGYAQIDVVNDGAGIRCCAVVVDVDELDITTVLVLKKALPVADVSRYVAKYVSQSSQ